MPCTVSMTSQNRWLSGLAKRWGGISTQISHGDRLSDGQRMCCATAGQQIAQSAASDGAPASAAVSEEEVRGPHASLAVRLQVLCLASMHHIT